MPAGIPAWQSKRLLHGALDNQGSQPVYAITWKDTISRWANEETSTKGR
jgi:hypothetical protein